MTAMASQTAMAGHDDVYKQTLLLSTYGLTLHDNNPSHHVFITTWFMKCPPKNISGNLNSTGGLGHSCPSSTVFILRISYLYRNRYEYLYMYVKMRMLQISQDLCIYMYINTHRTERGQKFDNFCNCIPFLCWVYIFENSEICIYMCIYMDVYGFTYIRLNRYVYIYMSVYMYYIHIILSK